MGQEQSTGKSIEEFLKEYSEIRTEHDNRLGEVKIYKKIKNPEIQVLSKEKWFEQKSVFESYQQKIKKRQSINNENVTPLLLTISKHLVIYSLKFSFLLNKFELPITLNRRQ